MSYVIIDTEVYKNYFLLSAMEVGSKKVEHFELSASHKINKERLAALMRSRTTVSFNGNGFDLPIIFCALRGWDNEKLKELSDHIIKSNKPAWAICRDRGINLPKNWDHIDIIEVAPGRSSLKIYGGRLHQEKLEDLPIDPDETLTAEQMEKIKSYCINDLETTLSLYRSLEKAIDLRISMSKQYKVDLRSKSDAQVAEEVIRNELFRMTGKRYSKPDNPPTSFRYHNPKIIEYTTDNLKSIFDRILKTEFYTGANGQVQMPEWLREPITIRGRTYQMGIGGLHSQESAQYVKADDEYDLLELDVASYYPSIILQQNLAPQTIGRPFLDVYRTLVQRRLKAKNEGDKVADAMLKIAINGSFGKLGSIYSAFYAPDLLIQTTVTGQLALLMLIEKLTESGIEVVSANTDGVVVHVKKEMNDVLDEIVFDWQLKTTYVLESNHYHSIASRNVNNYVAVAKDGSVKGKGCFAKSGLMKNPDMQIVYEAVAKEVAMGVDVADTITECKDITKFVSVRRVQGGAVWRGQELGRAVRFYYSIEVPSNESINYKTNSNRVPKSAGAKPIMNLPDTFPSDVNHKPYIDEAHKLLVEIGYESGELC